MVQRLEELKLSKSYRSAQWNEAQTLTKRKSKFAPYAVKETMLKYSKYMAWCTEVKRRNFSQGATLD